MVDTAPLARRNRGSFLLDRAPVLGLLHMLPLQAGPGREAGWTR